MDMDMETYITHKTGLEDPFHDYIDPNEEKADLSPHKSQTSQKMKEEDE